MSKYVPKHGETVKVSVDGVAFCEREFISITSNNRYLCWSEGKTEAYAWQYIQSIPEDPVYYYRWEYKSPDNVISLSHYMTIEYAKAQGYSEKDGWYRIDSSKRTWEH